MIANNENALDAWRGIESESTEITTKRDETTMTTLPNTACTVEGCSGDPLTHDSRDEEALHELAPAPGHAHDIHPSKYGDRPWVAFVGVEFGAEMTSAQLRELAGIFASEADRVDDLNDAIPAVVEPTFVDTRFAGGVSEVSHSMSDHDSSLSLVRFTMPGAGVQLFAHEAEMLASALQAHARSADRTDARTAAGALSDGD